MPNTKQDKYDLLASVIDAIYDENQDILVETTNLGAKSAKKYQWTITNLTEPQIPTIQGKTKYAGSSQNKLHAQSIKIGNISIRRVKLAPTFKKDGKLYANNDSYKYIVRTPNGEAEFSQTDEDFACVWLSALRKYDLDVVNGHKGKSSEMYRIMSDLYKHVKNQKLKEAAGKGITEKNNKSKYEKAIEKLKEMGIQPKRLLKYMQDKQND